ncbi:6-carboxytetrahydropterin synthase [Halobacteriovorax sp. HLS]|uniref:6-pyruvoyl trahydropterin synthase family protein n=1 Tax=Halobacteriovorax sp. HLS TaxID=2234000 RepID=UPI0013E30ACD|nr:6-carboxytetrahydropterin synthase [Halobacteriovorax sp. HLS]
MKSNYTLKVFKEYFNFACAHFMIFKDGSREPLHGHNYRVSVNGHHDSLNGDMVIDFLDLKPIVKKICDEIDHKLILPSECALLEINETEKQIEVKTPDNSFFSFPKSDVLVIPIKNSSVERLAGFIAKEIEIQLQKLFNFQFDILEVEVEESKGQSVIYRLFRDKE